MSTDNGLFLGESKRDRGHTFSLFFSLSLTHTKIHLMHKVTITNTQNSSHITYPKLWKSSRMVIMWLTIVRLIVVHTVWLIVLGLMRIFTGIIYHSRFHCFIQNLTFRRKGFSQFKTSMAHWLVIYFVYYFFYTSIQFLIPIHRNFPHTSRFGLFPSLKLFFWLSC